MLQHIKYGFSTMLPQLDGSLAISFKATYREDKATLIQNLARLAGCTETIYTNPSPNGRITLGFIARHGSPLLNIINQRRMIAKINKTGKLY